MDASEKLAPDTRKAVIEVGKHPEQFGKSGGKRETRAERAEQMTTGCTRQLKEEGGVVPSETKDETCLSSLGR